jgi:hypothetical protein
MTGSMRPPSDLVNAALKIAYHLMVPMKSDDQIQVVLAIGSYRIRLSSPDRELLNFLVRPFAHLIDDGHHGSDLCVHMDRAPAALESIPTTSMGDANALRGTLISFIAGPVRVSLQFDPSGKVALLSAFDFTERRAAYLTASVEAAHFAEGDRPFSNIFRWWSSGTQSIVVHGAAVGNSRRGALIVGGPGAGKSSLALAVCGRTVHFLGDDQVLLGPQQRIASLYMSASLRTDMIQQFTNDNCWFAPRWRAREKGATTTFAAKGARYVMRDVPLSTIVVLRHNQRPAPEFRPITTATALRMMAPSTLAFLCRSPVEDLDKLTALVSGVPAFELFTTTNLSQMRDAFEDFMAVREYGEWLSALR